MSEARPNPSFSPVSVQVYQLPATIILDLISWAGAVSASSNTLCMHSKVCVAECLPFLSPDVLALLSHSLSASK
jgi:hypothetical protein